MNVNSPDYERRYREAAGAVFSNLRARQNWSLREFAEHVGNVAHTSLYAIERGESTPSIDVLGRVAACFGMDLSGIMLLIVDQLDPEPSDLTALFDKYRMLSPEQRSEIATFVEFVEYRDASR
ncbi:MAG: helix-turn-helix transcriptional regulator [Thermomicrobiales bacterium]